jgi:hypothetical protein
MMAAHAKDRNLKNGSIVTAGTANAQTFLSGVTYTTVPTGLEVLLKIGPGLTSVDGTAVTLNMDGIGAVGVKDQEGEDVEIGLLAGSYARFLYNGTNWVFLDASITNTTIQITQVTVVEVSEGGTPVAFIDFTNLDTTKYQRYEIIGTNILVDTDEMGLTLNISTDNGTTFPFTGVNEYNSSEEYTSQRLTNDGDPYARSFSQTDHGRRNTITTLITTAQHWTATATASPRLIAMQSGCGRPRATSPPAPSRFTECCSDGLHS